MPLARVTRGRGTSSFFERRARDGDDRTNEFGELFSSVQVQTRTVCCLLVLTLSAEFSQFAWLWKELLVFFFHVKMPAMFSARRSVIKHIILVLFFLFLAVLSLGCSTVIAQSDPPTSTPAPSPTVTVSPTPTITATATTVATRPPTATITFTATPSITPVPTTAPNLAVAVTTPVGRSARVPILMYHHIAAAPAGADSVRVDLSVPPDIFDAELHLLHDRGFHTIHLADLANSLETGAPLPPKAFVLTFDDGYDDNYLNALPTLKSYGFIGTFFIITGFADQNAWGYMNWAQIQELAANGMEIGNHSVDHKFDLGKMSRSVQWAEIKPAYDDLAQRLPNQTLVFSYPSGSYNTTTLNLLQQFGYVAAVTTDQSSWQYGNAPLELNRIRIRGGWSLADFTHWLDYWTKGL